MEHNHKLTKQMELLQEALPNRPLKIKKTSDTGFFMILFFTILGAALVYFAFLGFMEIAEDKKIAENPVILSKASVAGECEGSRKLKFFVTCDVEMHYKDHHAERNFTFVDFSHHNYQVEVLAEKGNLDNMNVNLAIEKIGNRRWFLIGYGLFGLLLFLGGCLCFLELPKRRRLKNIINDQVNQPWQFVAYPAKLKDHEVSYTTNVDDAELEIGFDIDDKKGPIVLELIDEEESKFFVLALKAKTKDSHIVLLDDLKNINLTTAERNELKASINKMLALEID